MQIDIKGKINEKRLAFSNTLETIVNSIQIILIPLTLLIPLTKRR